MKRLGILLFGLGLGAMPGLHADELFFDRLRDTLTFSSPQGKVTGRVSGTMDLEYYAFESPAPGLIYTPDNELFSPRLTLFLDAQLGGSVYFFAQARVDQGFDPSEGSLRLRLDEYALRYTPLASGGLSVQAGRFATVVGSWVRRHGSWENPFITAPLAYDHLTGVWDVAAARSPGILLSWAHVIPSQLLPDEFMDKHLRLPVIWGPSYASGIAVMGEIGRFSYAAEAKGATLASRPESWSFDRETWQHPTFSARLGYRPNVMWNLGLSASQGVYLLPVAEPTIPAGYALGDYTQTVVGQEVGFAWRYWQIWAEAFQAQFNVPQVGRAETFSAYVEVKYKFTARFSGAVRWNQQDSGSIRRTSGQRVDWGRDTWRLDLAPAYRFSPQTQVKLQFSLQHEAGLKNNPRQLVSGQFTTRF